MINLGRADSMCRVSNCSFPLLPIKTALLRCAVIICITVSPQSLWRGVFFHPLPVCVSMACCISIIMEVR